MASSPARSPSVSCLRPASASTSPVRPGLEGIAQTRYEQSFRKELDKLETAIANQRILTAIEQARVEELRRAEYERKVREGEKAQKLRQLQQAVDYAKKQDEKNFLERVGCMYRNVHGHETPPRIARLRHS